MATSEQIRDTLEVFASTIDLAVIAIEDLEHYPILIARRCEPFFGYSDQELTGKAFEELLPPSIRPRHHFLMQGFKGESNAGHSRQMGGNRTVEGYTAKGDLVPLSVAISYHEGDVDTPGIFLALLQDPADTLKKGDDLSDIQQLFTRLLRPTRIAVKKTRKAIARKVAASGGAFGFTVWLLTQITPLGTAIKSFYTAWNWKLNNPTLDSTAIVETIGEKTRYENLGLIRNAMQKRNPLVIGVGYFELSETDDGAQIRYIGDSNTAQNEELWFYDRVDGKVILNEGDRTRFKQFECILKQGAADTPNAAKKRVFNVIFCPTFQIVKDKDNPGLRRIGARNLLGVAVDRSITNPEPIGTTLWTYIPNVENVNTPP